MKRPNYALGDALMVAAIILSLMVLASFPADARAVQARPSTHFDLDVMELPPGFDRVPAIYRPEPAAAVPAEVADFDPIGWVLVVFIVLGGFGYVVFLVLHPWKFPACVETAEETPKP